MKIKYTGQAGFIIETMGKTLVIDPFISANEAMNGILKVEDIKCDYVLLTHGHQDHVLDAEQIAKQNGAKIISNYEIVSYYGQRGVEGHPMNHGGDWKFDFGMVKFVNAIHSSVLPDGTYAGNPGGFVVWNEEGCFYHAGDTALTMDMKLIPMTCPKLDFAILPVGNNFTMGYNDAVIAAEFIECDKIIACHFDTFPVIEVNHEDAKDTFSKRQKELLMLDLGQEIEI